MSLVAAGVMAAGLVCVLALAEMLPTLLHAEMALPPVQAAGVLRGDPSVPTAAMVFDGRETGLQESAPTI